MDVSDPEPRPRSIADMLVESEGYPAPDEATLPLPPNGMTAESDKMLEPTTVLATTASDSTPSDTATFDSTPSDTTAPHKSYAEMLIKTDYFPREDAENASDGTAQPTQSEQSATQSDEIVDSLKSPETQESQAGAPQSATQPQQSQQPRRKSLRDCRCRAPFVSLPRQIPVRRSTADSAVFAATSRWKGMCRAMAHWYWRTRRSQSNTISGIAHRNPYPHPKKRVKHLVKTFASN